MLVKVVARHIFLNYKREQCMSLDTGGKLNSQPLIMNFEANAVCFLALYNPFAFNDITGMSGQRCGTLVALVPVTG